MAAFYALYANKKMPQTQQVESTANDADGRDRTGTDKPGDFKSPASANSATPANAFIISRKARGCQSKAATGHPVAALFMDFMNAVDFDHINRSFGTPGSYFLSFGGSRRSSGLLMSFENERSAIA